MGISHQFQSNLEFIFAHVYVPCADCYSLSPLTTLTPNQKDKPKQSVVTVKTRDCKDKNNEGFKPTAVVIASSLTGLLQPVSVHVLTAVTALSTEMG